MSNKLFSMVSISSVLFSGGAFSMEEPVEFRGQRFPATPITKEKVEEFHLKYPNTDAVKAKVHADLGDLDGVSTRLAQLIFSEKVGEALDEREKDANQVQVFLSQRRSEHEYLAASQKSEQELQEQIELIRSLTETLRTEYDQKNTEISFLNISIQEFKDQMEELETKLSKSQTESLSSQAESEEILTFYEKRLLTLKSSLAEAQDQLLRANMEKVDLKSQTKKLGLQVKHNVILLEAYSPLKKVLGQKVVKKSSPSTIISDGIAEDGIAGVTAQVNTEDGVSDDSDVDLDS